MNLHNKIMNIECVQPDDKPATAKLSYKLGHKSARHTAAELALQADKEIESLKDVIRRLLSCDIDENINIDGSAGAMKAARIAVVEPLPKDLQRKDS